MSITTLVSTGSLLPCVVLLCGLTLIVVPAQVEQGFSVLQAASTRGIWVVVKIMVPFWVAQILGAVLYEGPKKGP